MVTGQHPLPRVKPRLPVPSKDELGKRGLTFERVHPDYESPVRLRLRGAALGIFSTRGDAAQLIKNLP